MPGALGEIIAVVLLAGTLGFAVIRPWGLPEAVAAVPASLLVIVLKILPVRHAAEEVSSLGPTIAFLAAILVLAELCDREGLFEAAGHWMARGCRGRPVALLALVFLISSSVTSVLSLDATVVLLTPVVLATAARLKLRSKPHAYACAHLANSASLLLPVSNLTNLLAFQASGLSFIHFGAVMVLPSLAAIGVEWVALRRFFASDLVGQGQSALGPGSRAPLYALVVLGLTLAGFAVTSLAHLDPVLAAAGGVTALAVPAVATGRTSLLDLVRAAGLPFLAFVLALGILVRAAFAGGLDAVVVRLVPGGDSFWSLLGIAVLAVVLANIVNNLPAILILLPAVAAAGTGSVLAALIGANIGPNLTYAGSLATLLWRNALQARNAEPPTAEFVRLGVVTVPAGVIAATAGLWLARSVLK